MNIAEQLKFDHFSREAKWLAWIVAGLALLALTAFAETVTWDASPSPGVTGYRLYWSTNGLAPWTVIWTGSTLSAPGSTNKTGTNFYTVTATNACCESDFSEIVSRPHKPGHVKAQ